MKKRPPSLAGLYGQRVNAPPRRGSTFAPSLDTSRPRQSAAQRRRQAGRRRLIAAIVLCPALAALSLLAAAQAMRPAVGPTYRGQTVAAWAAALGDPDAARRNQAVEALIEIREPGVSHLVQALRSPSLPVRRDAALVLQKIGTTDHYAVKGLAGALADRDRWVRWRAAETLAGMGPAAKEAVLPLAEALSDDDARIRFAAAQALGNIGEPAILAHPALIEAMQDERTYVRRAATEAMRRIMPHLE